MTTILPPITKRVYTRITQTQRWAMHQSGDCYAVMPGGEARFVKTIDKPHMLTTVNEHDVFCCDKNYKPFKYLTTERSRTTRRKYLCVGGPHAGKRFVTGDKRLAGYDAFNSAGVSKESFIFVWGKDI